MKNFEAYKTIGEVSKELDIETHVLRFWEEKFSQIKPIKRNGGRRHYRLEDINTLRNIKKMLHEDGFTIKGVQKYLNSMNIDRVRKLGRVKLDKTVVLDLKRMRKELLDIKSDLQ